MSGDHEPAIANRRTAALDAIIRCTATHTGEITWHDLDDAAPSDVDATTLKRAIVDALALGWIQPSDDQEPDLPLDTADTRNSDEFRVQPGPRASDFLDTTSTSSERDDLYKRAQIAWGRDAQLAKAAEEFSELAAEIHRLQNDQADLGDVLDELADAKVMIEQLETDFTDDAVDEAFERKIDALRDRLPGGGGGDS